MEFGFAPLVGGSGWKMKGSEGEGVPLLRTGEDEGEGSSNGCTAQVDLAIVYGVAQRDTLCGCAA